MAIDVCENCLAIKIILTLASRHVCNKNAPISLRYHVPSSHSGLMVFEYKMVSNIGNSIKNSKILVGPKRSKRSLKVQKSPKGSLEVSAKEHSTVRNKATLKPGCVN